MSMTRPKRDLEETIDSTPQKPHYTASSYEDTKSVISITKDPNVMSNNIANAVSNLVRLHALNNDTNVPELAKKTLDDDIKRNMGNLYDNLYSGLFNHKGEYTSVKGQYYRKDVNGEVTGKVAHDKATVDAWKKGYGSFDDISELSAHYTNAASDAIVDISKDIVNNKFLNVNEKKQELHAVFDTYNKHLAIHPLAEKPEARINRRTTTDALIIGETQYENVRDFRNESHRAQDVGLDL